MSKLWPFIFNEAVENDPELEHFRDLCETVTEYYLAERYPSEGSIGYEEAEVRQAFHQVKEMIGVVKEKSPPEDSIES